MAHCNTVINQIIKIFSRHEFETLAALEFYGKAHSVHENFYYLTNTFPRPLTFRGYRFRGVRFPKKLGDDKRLFGVSAEERSGVSVRLTSLERTMVDVLDRTDLGGGWEEI